MKVSEITVNNIAEYLKYDDPENLSESDKIHLASLLSATKAFISDYTGIPIKSDVAEAETLDSHEDFYIVVMVLCQDMHDNRSMYVDKSNLNKVVDTILGMHRKNLI